jgi:IclR family pca regulon transcriptional regulator
MVTEPRRSESYVESLARGLSVLEAFSQLGDSATLTEVAQLVGLPKATCRRLLLTLTELGYLTSSDGTFKLTARVLDLGYAYLSRLPFGDRATPLLNRLTEQLHQSCSIAVLEGTDVVYVARVAVQRLLSVQVHVGTRLPAYASALGRVLLANLPERQREATLQQIEVEQLTEFTVPSRDALRANFDLIRKQGFAIVSQEIELGLSSVAVPLRNPRTGEVVAALNCSGAVDLDASKFLQGEALPKLQAAAAEFEQLLSS